MFFLSWLNLPLFPTDASTTAGRVDSLYFFLVGVTLFFTGLICSMIIFFMIKYRRSRHPRAAQIPSEVRSDVRPSAHAPSNLTLELLWTGIPLAIAMIIYVWGATLYFDLYRPPENASDIYVVGRQWMWKVQHTQGPREINELHVPVGRPIKLTMVSEDVIHSFFIPAFRTKHDVLPGRLSNIWFEATKPGEYHLFCAEYCGTEHSRMRGRVVVMEPADFERWLSGGEAGVSMATAGERLFMQLGCQNCHNTTASARCPLLTGKFGSQVQLKSGQMVTLDESYIRESILDPAAKVVAGYEAIMPSYRGLISEEGLMQIIEYLRSTSQAATAPAVTP